MPQIYNAGNDFVSAYSRGIQDRLDAEKLAQAKQQWLDELPLKKKHMEALVDAEHQRGEAARAEIGSHVENLKHQVMSDFATGLRQPSPDSISMNLQQDPSAQPQIDNNFQDQLPQQTQTLSNSLNPTASQNQTVDVDPRLVSSGKLNLSGVSFPQDMLKQKLASLYSEIPAEAAKAGAVATATEIPKVKGQLLVEGQKQAGAKDLKKQEEEAQKTLQIQKDAAEMERVKLQQTEALKRTLSTVSGQITGHQIAAAAVRYTADHKTSTALDPGVIEDAAMMSMLGETPLPGYNNSGMATKSVIHKAGGVPFDKKDADKLKSVSDVSTLMDYMTDNIKNLPDSAIGAFAQKMGAKIPGTDVSNIYNNVFGRAANISHTYGGEIGRLSDPDVQRAMGILAAPGMTKENALKNLQQIKLETTSKVLNNIMGGLPTSQQLLVLEHNKFDPESFVVKGKDGHLYSKFKKSPDGEWGVFDPKKMSYSAVHGEN